MQKNSRASGWIILLLIFSWPLVTQAKIVGLLDFDGTIVEDRGPFAAWITPWILKRVEQIHSVAQQLPNHPIDVQLREPEQIEYYASTSPDTHQSANGRVRLDLPDQIGVSYDEYLFLQADLAKGESVLGGLHPRLLKHDPIFPTRARLIVPGYYRPFDLTFKYYRESSGLRPKNFLKQNLQQARERVRVLGGEHQWQGRAFPLFRALMAAPETVANAHIFTSRGHNQKEFAATWEDMAKHGDIRYAKGLRQRGPTVYSLGQPEARIFGRSLVEKKLSVVKAVLEALYHSAGPRHLILDTEGRARWVHTLIVAEDEPSYVEAIAEFMLNMSGSYYADRVQMVLFHTGDESELANARFKSRWTKFLAGRKVGPASPDEIAEWFDPEFHQKALGLDCASRLSSVQPQEAP